MKTIEGHLVDVHKQRIYDAQITIKEGIISAIRPLSSPLSGDAPYLMPGFVDSHIHIESTLLVPHLFAPLAVAQGSVAVVADPHEIANVLGVEGVDFMLADAGTVRFGFNFAVPSCVPSTPFETAGAALDADAVSLLLHRNGVVALAEMMNVPGVLNADAQVMAKITAARDCGKPVDGHAPLLGGDALRRYVAAGITTDHECSTLEEAEEKLAAGMMIMIREGSAARNFDTLAPLLNRYGDRLMFCTDDIYPDELLQGHINVMVRRAVAEGLPLWNVLRAACVNPVEHYHLTTGLLREGDRADFIAVGDLRQFEVRATYIGGEEVFCHNEGVLPALTCGRLDKTCPNNFHAARLSQDALSVPVRGRRMRVITATDGQLLTGCEVVDAFEFGSVPSHVMMHDTPYRVINDLSENPHDIQKIVVYNRYQSAEPQVAYIKGFGLRKGAFAASVAHDCHNLVAVGCSDADLVEVINRLVDTRGGFAVTDGCEMLDLPLPVAGLMSAQPGSEVAQRLVSLKQRIRDLGCTMAAPLMTLSFMALPVIPALKLTDMGLFDGEKFQFTELFCD